MCRGFHGRPSSVACLRTVIMSHIKFGRVRSLLDQIRWAVCGAQFGRDPILNNFQLPVPKHLDSRKQHPICRRHLGALFVKEKKKPLSTATRDCGPTTCLNGRPTNFSLHLLRTKSLKTFTHGGPLGLPPVDSCESERARRKKRIEIAFADDTHANTDTDTNARLSSCARDVIPRQEGCPDKKKKTRHTWAR